MPTPYDDAANTINTNSDLRKITIFNLIYTNQRYPRDFSVFLYNPHISSVDDDIEEIAITDEEKKNPRSKKISRNTRLEKLLKIRPLDDQDKERMSDDKKKSMDRYRND